MKVFAVVLISALVSVVVRAFINLNDPFWYTPIFWAIGYFTGRICGWLYDDSPLR